MEKVRLTSIRPHVIFSELAKQKYKWLVATESIEVCWLGVGYHETNDIGLLTINVVDILVPEQENTAVTTTATLKYMEEKFRNELEAVEKPEGIEKLLLVLWGHSHVNMAVNPSAQDLKEIEDFTSMYPFMIMQIVNKAGAETMELWKRSSEFKGVITIQNCLNYEASILSEEWKKASKARLEEKKYSTPLTAITHETGMSTQGTGTKNETVALKAEVSGKIPVFGFAL